jgi:hypothetical protein
MRGGVAISVTATPAAAPRRIREVLRIIIREPSGLHLRPTMGLGSTGTPSLRRSGLAVSARPITGSTRAKGEKPLAVKLMVSVIVIALAVFVASALSATAQIAANKGKDFMAVTPSQ